MHNKQSNRNEEPYYACTCTFSPFFLLL